MKRLPQPTQNRDEDSKTTTTHTAKTHTKTQEKTKPTDTKQIQDDSEDEEWRIEQDIAREQKDHARQNTGQDIPHKHTQDNGDHLLKGHIEDTTHDEKKKTQKERKHPSGQVIKPNKAGRHMWLSQVEYPNTKHLCVSSNGCLKIWPRKKYFSKKISKGGEKFFFNFFFREKYFSERNTPFF